MPTELTKHHEEGFTFAEVPVSDVIAGKYDELDPDCVNLLKNSVDRMPWRLYVHQPYDVRLVGSLVLHPFSLNLFTALVQRQHLHPRMSHCFLFVYQSFSICRVLPPSCSSTIFSTMTGG